MREKIFIIIIVFFTNNIYTQNIDLNIGETKSKNYFEEIVFEFINNKIIVPIEIEGKTYKFLLDTGAPNMISKEIHDLIKPKHINSVPITDASGKIENMDVVSVENLKFGNISFEQTATLVYDFNSSPLKCFGIDGFIGSNMLRNSIIQIDLEKKIIRLTDKTKNLVFNKSESSKILLVGSQSSPYLWINLKGQKKGKEQVLIDTGMGELYAISDRNYKIFKKEKIFNVIGQSEGASAMGLFGDVAVNDHFRLHLPILIINNFQLENYITTTSNDNNSKIGTEILNHGIMTIDYINKKFHFQTKNKSVNTQKLQFEFSKTLKNKKLIVGFVWDEELKNKISYGDEIIEINGVEINESKICDIITNELVSENENTVKLKIKSKKEEVFEVTIIKKLPPKPYIIYAQIGSSTN